MMYSTARTDVKTIVQWLRGRDESRWEEQTKLLFETIGELREMSHPIADPDPPRRRSRAAPDVPRPGTASINDGMPYLRGMLASMFGHNRRDALEYGETALAFLPEG